MTKNNKGDELEDKLIEELEEDYDESKGNRKLLVIGGVVAVVLIAIAIILSLVAGNKKSATTSTKEGAGETAADGSTQQPTIAYDQDFSRDAGSETAQKAGEPSTPYPAKTSGARVAVDQSGKSIEGTPVQKSLMIDDRENPFHALHTIAPEIFDLMEINLYSVQNKQLSLGELVDKTRLAIPDTIFNHLDNFYRIFMYRGADEKGPGTAIVFSTGINKAELATAMTSWENTMVNNLRSFVNIGLKKDFVEASGQKNFQSSSLYRGGRFVDFSANGVVSLNYIVVDKYIILANSRSTFEKTISLLQKK
ncbi:MAG: hypothetical protein V1690_02735 [Candidatus Moraniibacteriota bacterium]